MRGVCPECGLDHRWRDVLNPAFAIPAWFIENPECKIRRSLPVTIARCCRPTTFWRSIWMTHPFVGPLIALFAAVTIVIVLVFAYGCVSVFTQIDGRAVLSDNPFIVFDPFSLLAYEYERSSAWVWMVILWAALTPFGMVALVHTRRLARVRREHLIRGGVYSIPLIGMLVVANSLVRGVSEFRYPLRRQGWWVPTTIPAWEIKLWDGIEIIEGYLLVVLAGFVLHRYWNAMTRGYMRLSQPRATAAILMVTSGLASLAIVELVGGRAIFFDMMMRLGDWGIWE